MNTFLRAFQENLSPTQQKSSTSETLKTFPHGFVLAESGELLPFHKAQWAIMDAVTRIVAGVAGTQGGKTLTAPVWMYREIFGGVLGGEPFKGRGGGDYLAVTATYDLFKMKMLPAFLMLFVEYLGIGRYWNSDKVSDLKDPQTGQFLATNSQSRMWGRIILRSADALRGLESGTVKAMVLDEAGMDTFSHAAYKALKRRGAIWHARQLILTTLYNFDWLKTQIIDKAEEDGTQEFEVLENGAEITITRNPLPKLGGITLIQYDSIVNPAYDMSEFEAARDDNASDEFEMFWRGRVTVLRLNIYDTFDDKVDTCNPFAIPFWWERYLGLDFGGVNLVGLFIAAEPNTDRLFAYREYAGGRLTTAEHAEELLRGEPMIPKAWGGAPSEHQWLRDFAAAGLPIEKPAVAEVWAGIQRVYTIKKHHRLIYFNSLSHTIKQVKTYRRKRDSEGNPLQEIEGKSTYHFMDAERYVLSSLGEFESGAGSVEEY